MPKKYLQNEFLFNQMRFFIHARAGAMTNIAISEIPI